MQASAHIGNTIETWGVLPDEMDGYDITLVSNGLIDERLVPRQVLYDSVDAAAAQSCRKHDDVIGAGEYLFDHCGQISRLVPDFVYWHTEGSKTTQVHQEIVY